MQKFHLCLQPGSAGTDFQSGGFLVKTDLAFGLEFEMFDHVRYINSRTLQTRFSEGLIQQLSSWTHERPSLTIFTVSRLLTQEDNPSIVGTFAKNGLSGITIE